MRWPWVSRTTFDLLMDERDRLRTEVDQLRNALVAIERKQNGMPELPRERPRGPQKPIEIPPDVMERINAFGSEANRMALQQQVENLVRGGAPWEEIRKQLDAQTGTVEDALQAETVKL